MSELNQLAPLRVLLPLLEGTASSRAQVSRLTGLARSTVGNHVEQLLDRGILIERAAAAGGRGRPPLRLAPGPSAPSIGIVDLGADAVHIAVSDLCGSILETKLIPVTMASISPDRLTPQVTEVLAALAARAARVAGRMLQVVVSVPHPVSSAGELARTARMSDWAGLPLARVLTERLGVPVKVDNDANVRAVGESARLGAAARPLVYAHLSTGIGLGLVDENGNVHRGASGSAGDISHIPVPSAAGTRCECGRQGCVVAVAGLERLAARVATEGVTDLDGLARRVLSGDSAVIAEVSRSAVAIGELLGIVADMYNPRVIVLGGELGRLQDQLLPTVRSLVYERALPLATRDLSIIATPVDRDPVLQGAVITGRDLLAASSDFQDLIR